MSGNSGVAKWGYSDNPQRERKSVMSIHTIGIIIKALYTFYLKLTIEGGLGEEMGRVEKKGGVGTRGKIFSM